MVEAVGGNGRRRQGGAERNEPLSFGDSQDLNRSVACRPFSSSAMRDGYAFVNDAKFVASREPFSRRITTTGQRLAERPRPTSKDWISDQPINPQSKAQGAIPRRPPQPLIFRPHAVHRLPCSRRPQKDHSANPRGSHTEGIGPVNPQLTPAWHCHRGQASVNLLDAAADLGRRFHTPSG